MSKKSTVSQLEREKEVVIEAMKVWPEKRDEYMEYLVKLNGQIGRTKRAARMHKAKAVQQKLKQ